VVCRRPPIVKVCAPKGGTGKLFGKACMSLKGGGGGGGCANERAPLPNTERGGVRRNEKRKREGGCPLGRDQGGVVEGLGKRKTAAYGRKGLSRREKKRTKKRANKLAVTPDRGGTEAGGGGPKRILKGDDGGGLSCVWNRETRERRNPAGEKGSMCHRRGGRPNSSPIQGVSKGGVKAFIRESGEKVGGANSHLLQRTGGGGSKIVHRNAEMGKGVGFPRGVYSTREKKERGRASFLSKRKKKHPHNTRKLLEHRYMQRCSQSIMGEAPVSQKRS